MENASKALIIAGAILISILLIGVAMFVYQSATGTIDSAVQQMSSTEKNMFNQQFEQYAGTKVNGSNVKALIQKIRDNNSTYADVPDKQVRLYLEESDDETTDYGKAISKIVTAATYYVECNVDNSGLVKAIRIVYNR